MRRKLTLVLSCFFTGIALAQPTQAPKLVVGIVVDQMCYDYIARFGHNFGPNGFHQLVNKGAFCMNTTYNYAPTLTGPGHASIYTGTTPSNHGIIANEWYRKDTKTTINCVDDTNYNTVGSSSDAGVCSPQQLKSLTVTDQLKLSFPHAKIISLSIKDRGAILPGGHLADGAYWYDPSVGKMITSSYYKQALPAWMNDFNMNHSVASIMQSGWSCSVTSKPFNNDVDSSKYERSIIKGQPPVFPYDFSHLKPEEQYALFGYTPHANTYLTQAAIQALINEQLGHDKVTDMLCISYSTPDLVGHNYGPYSKELEDIYIRLDQDIALLIRTLNQTVGKSNYTLFLTADHAVAPIPQHMIDQRLPGGYFDSQHLKETLLKKLNENYGLTIDLVIQNNNIYVDQATKVYVDQDIIGKIKSILKDYPGIRKVYTREELTNTYLNEPEFELVKRGYAQRENGDLILVLDPNVIPAHNTEESHKGTTHGSVYNYDTHVPLIWYGKHINTGKYVNPISITDVAATLSTLLNIQRPASMTGTCIPGLLKLK